MINAILELKTVVEDKGLQYIINVTIYEKSSMLICKNIITNTIKYNLSILNNNPDINIYIQGSINSLIKYIKLLLFDNNTRKELIIFLSQYIDKREVFINDD